MNKSCSSTRRMKPLLGTFVEVGTTDRDMALSELNPVFDVLEQIHNLLSFHNPRSDLSRLNSNPGKFVELNQLSIRALKLAKALAMKTNDQFNPTVGGKLVELGRLPKHHSYSEKTIGIGSSVDLEIRGSAARLLRPVLVTLDGIAKGFAVDLGIEKMKELGFRSGWINAGGDLRVFGDCKLPVKRRLVNGSFENLGVFQNVALASSHISDEPLADFSSWIVSPQMKVRGTKICTVVAKKAWRADALTKVAILNEKNLELVFALGGKVVTEP